ncbi:MAG: acylneuraminate cytidylyltransferase family protein [Anaerolineae bacterium]|nr:acylneuraminate cytidylyltransferase family protein [Anaerolineae bacterium]
MVNQPEVLAIIPARGGSKSIPGKNIKPLAGIPLIAYSIAAGVQAQTVTRVIVSTDSEEIAEVSRQYGAEIPFMRPAEHAQDSTPDLPVFVHALKWLYEMENYQPDVVVHLRATSPFRQLSCVDDGVRMLLDDPQADCVRGMINAQQNPYKMWQPDPDSPYARPLLRLDGIAEPYNAPRQKLPPTYWQTGHLDVIRPATILEKNSMTGDHIRALLIDERYTIDIDTPLDWEAAEMMIERLALPLVKPE